MRDHAGSPKCHSIRPLSPSHRNLIEIRHLRLALATLVGNNPLMNIRRILFLCLLTVTLAVTGPFARGLSAQAAALSQTAELTRPGAMTTLKTGAAAAKRCQRGAVAWSSCAIDLGYVPGTSRIEMAGAGRAFDRVLDGTAGGLWHSRLFRPPRSG